MGQLGGKGRMACLHGRGCACLGESALRRVGRRLRGDRLNVRQDVLADIRAGAPRERRRAHECGGVRFHALRIQVLIERGVGVFQRVAQRGGRVLQQQRATLKVEIQ